MDLNKNGKNDFKELAEWFKGLFDFNEDKVVNFEDFTYILCKIVDDFGDKDGKVEIADVISILKRSGISIKSLDIIKELAFIFGDGKLSINDIVALWHLINRLKGYSD